MSNNRITEVEKLVNAYLEKMYITNTEINQSVNVDSCIVDVEIKINGHLLVSVAKGLQDESS